MEENNSKIRTNIFLASNIKNYVDTQSDIMGMSNSAFITMCINLYRQQSEAQAVMSKFDDLLKELKALQEVNKNE